jgi:hypothetical protein
MYEKDSLVFDNCPVRLDFTQSCQCGNEFIRPTDFG